MVSFSGMVELLSYPPPSKQMQDEGDERNDKQQMDRATGDMEQSPHDEPQHEQPHEKNKEYEITQESHSH
jgi:hypothetical protein